MVSPFFTQDLIRKLLKDILIYYVNMGASQFLRDYCRSSLIKKSVELRKRILRRQEKTKEKTDSVPFKVLNCCVYGGGGGLCCEVQSPTLDTILTRKISPLRT